MPQPEPIEPGSHEWEVARNRAEMRGFIPEIRLAPATVALKADFISGMENVLFGPDSATVTAEETDTKDNFRLNHTKSIGRVAFLHLEDASAAGANRPFDLALGVFSRNLDLETVSQMSEEELKEYEYDTFDGIYLIMLDILLQNDIDISIHHGDKGCRYGFQYYGSIGGPAGGYRYKPGQADDIFRNAFQIDTGYQATRGEAILGSHIEEFQVLVDILQNGQPNQQARDNLAQASQSGDSIVIIPEGSDEAEKLSPFMYGLFKDALETPDLRDGFARHQYNHAKRPGYLVR